jgi:hypothetical protein
MSTAKEEELMVDCMCMQGLEGDSTPRRYFYISFLREPVARYLSEFRFRCAPFLLSFNLIDKFCPYPDLRNG